MSAMQPEQARFLFDTVFVPALRDEHQTTRNVIAAIPADQSDYKPDTISKSAIELAWHITVTEMRFLESVAVGVFDLNPRP